MKLSNLLRKAQSVKQKLEHPYTAAVIVAAGSATRMGGVDKIFAPIAKLPVICRTLAAFKSEAHTPDWPEQQSPSRPPQRSWTYPPASCRAKTQ